MNDIIVKIEMKKFQNLIANRKQRKNNLVNQDIKRIYPLNKIQDGSACVAEAPLSFKEGIGKFNPKLFNVYEKAAKSQTSMARNRKSFLTSAGFSKKMSVERE